MCDQPSSKFRKETKQQNETRKKIKSNQPLYITIVHGETQRLFGLLFHTPKYKINSILTQLHADFICCFEFYSLPV